MNENNTVTPYKHKHRVREDSILVNTIDKLSNLPRFTAFIASDCV